MKKYAFFWLFVTLTTVFLSGCGGRWCTADNGYCFEGFNGPTRVQSFQYGYSYTSSDLRIVNELDPSCSLNILPDEQDKISGLERGDYTWIKFHVNPGETRKVTILIQKYCGKGKKKSYSSLKCDFIVTATKKISETWILTDDHFPSKTARRVFWKPL